MTRYAKTILLVSGDYSLKAHKAQEQKPDELKHKIHKFSQLSPCEHLTITDTFIIRTAAKFPAKINYRRLTERHSRYYGTSLLRTLTRGPENESAIKRVNCIHKTVSEEALLSSLFFS